MTDKKKVKLYLLIIPFVTMLFYSLVVLGNIYILSRKNELISPAFSGRISLDEKISWLASHLSNGCDVLAIGSSMTLTNVNSAVITKAFPGMSYINAASWGMTPRHDLQMLRLLMNYCAPKILILACNLWDFRNDDTAEDLFDKNDVENFLNTKDYAWAYLKYFSVDYYWKRAGSIDAMRNEKHRYNTLDFDGHGGAPISYIDLSIKGQKAVYRRRWNRDRSIPLAEVDKSNYDALKAIAKLSNAHNIQFIVAQTPVRKSFLGAEATKRLSWHRNKIHKISSNYGFIYFDGLASLNLSDDMFIDTIHLNAKGAKIFTSNMIAKYKVSSDKLKLNKY